MVLDTDYQTKYPIVPHMFLPQWVGAATILPPSTQHFGAMIDRVITKSEVRLAVLQIVLYLAMNEFVVLLKASTTGQVCVEVNSAASG